MERISPDVLGQQKEVELQKFEFRSLGNSRFYTNDVFTVALNDEGGYEFFETYDKYIPEDTVRAIFQDKYRGEYPGFVIIGSERTHIDVPGHVSGSYRSVMENFGTPLTKEEINNIANQPIEQQLLHAGFVDKQRGVFELHLEDEGKTLDVTAVVVDGKLQKLLKPTRRSVREKVTPETHIVGIGEWEDNGPHATFMKDKADVFPAITLSNAQMDFQLIARYGIEIANGSQHVHRELTPDEVGVKPLQEVVDGSGFVIGGRNTTDKIVSLNVINSLSIQQLEALMRPGVYGGGRRDSHGISDAGFLGEDESLLQVMAMDNNFVLSRGLTHQQIASPLLYAMNFYEKGFGNSFLFNNVEYKIDATSYRGSQESPFYDGTYSDTNFWVTNTQTGKTIGFSGLIPEMIQRYGFYEGRGTSYRLEPQDIIELFALA